MLPEAETQGPGLSGLSLSPEEDTSVGVPMMGALGMQGARGNRGHGALGVGRAGPWRFGAALSSLIILVGSSGWIPSGVSLCQSLGCDVGPSVTHTFQVHQIFMCSSLPSMSQTPLHQTGGRVLVLCNSLCGKK